jgi:hypothetical protein
MWFLVSSVAGVADPDRGAERLSERFLAAVWVRRNGFVFVVVFHATTHPGP